MVHSLFVRVSIKSGCATASVSFAAHRQGGVPESTRLDLFDIDLIALLQPGVAVAAVRAGLAVLYGRVSGLTVVAPGDGRNDLIQEFRALNDRLLLGIPVPAIFKIFRHNAGDLTEFERDRLDLGEVVFLGNLLHLLDNISNDTQLVHGGSFQAGGHSGKGSVPAS
jgi:hypothetical protein